MCPGAWLAGRRGRSRTRRESLHCTNTNATHVRKRTREGKTQPNSGGSSEEARVLEVRDVVDGLAVADEVEVNCAHCHACENAATWFGVREDSVLVVSCRCRLVCRMVKTGLCV